MAFDPKEYAKKYYENNKDKIRNRFNIWYEKNKEREIEKKREYYRNHKESLSEYSRKYREERKEELLEKKRIYGRSDNAKELRKKARLDPSRNEKIKKRKRESYHRHKDEIRERRNPRQAEKRFTVFKECVERYGGKCQDCGFDNITALVIHHVNGGGSEHRKNMKADSIYGDLKSKGYPPLEDLELRLLCANCHVIVHDRKFNMAMRNGG